VIVQKGKMNRIEELEKKPLSDADLRRMLGKDRARCKVILYNELQKYTNMDELLPNEGQCVIVLLQIETPGATPVGHWICMLNHGSHYEHFDSYGLDPDEELGLTHEQPYLTNIIKNTNKRVGTSSYRLQAKKEAVNTCGRWAVTRVKHAELENPEFVKLIRAQHPIPDVAVTLMTQFL
jgi:hypothetical protein